MQSRTHEKLAFSVAQVMYAQSVVQEKIALHIVDSSVAQTDRLSSDLSSRVALAALSLVPAHDAFLLVVLTNRMVRIRPVDDAETTKCRFRPTVREMKGTVSCCLVGGQINSQSDDDSYDDDEQNASNHTRRDHCHCKAKQNT